MWYFNGKINVSSIIYIVVIFWWFDTGLSSNGNTRVSKPALSTVENLATVSRQNIISIFCCFTRFAYTGFSSQGVGNTFIENYWTQKDEDKNETKNQPMENN